MSSYVWRGPEPPSETTVSDRKCELNRNVVNYKR